MTKPRTSGDPYMFKWFDNIRFAHIIHFIWSSTSDDSEFYAVPHLLPFHPSLGQYYQRWASSKKWIVAEFPMFHSDTQNGQRYDSQNNKRNGAQRSAMGRMIVKVSIPHDNRNHAQPYYHNELQHLHLIPCTQQNAPDSLPNLVWDPRGDIMNQPIRCSPVRDHTCRRAYQCEYFFHYCTH